MAYYITQADIEARVSARVLRQVFDDDRSGTADAANITQLITDAESYVEEIVGCTYVIADVRTSAPNAMKRLCLDAAVAYMRERWPSLTKTLTAKAWERLAKECSEVRLATRRVLPAGTQGVPANTGGTVDPGTPDELADEGIYQMWGFGNTGVY